MIARIETLFRLAMCATLLAASPAWAQKTAVVTGTVRDEHGDPIVEADVSVIKTSLHAYTDVNGAFRIEGVPDGKYWLGVRRLGFEPVAHSMTISGNTARKMDVEMNVLPVKLSPVEVKAKSGYTDRWMNDFDRRRRSAFGHFITRDDIEQRNPTRLSWLVQMYFPRLSSTAFDYSPWEAESYAPFGGGRTIGVRCAPAVSVNGSTPRLGWALNDFQPSEVEAMEVYRPTIGEMPMEFQMIRGTQCGVVVVWLR
jgi:hypothetical protein